MLKVTIFGGHDGRLGLQGQVYFTIFGSCTLVRPTIAWQLVSQRRAAQREHGENAPSNSWQNKLGLSRGRESRNKPFFFTVFGGTELKSPTLAEEFIDLREAIQSGLLTLDDVDKLLADLTQSEPSIGSFTIFASLNECALPEENAEVDSLAVHRHLGSVSERAGGVLQMGIGQREGERRATIRQAILVEA